MTLLASWIGIDTHGPTSAYIVSDSRFSWNKNEYFDYGKKVFASHTYTEILGYAGDVLFPSTVLSQIIEMIDTGVLFDTKMNCDQKNRLIFEKLCYSFSKYPTKFTGDIVQVLHISRDTVFDKYPQFYGYFLSWTKIKGWEFQKVVLPQTSDILYVLGSGKNEFNQNYLRYQLGVNRDTSRNVFHCFIDTLFNTKDMYCGGPPQLVGIYRKPNTVAKNFGIIYQNKRYFLGAEVPAGTSYDKIEWRNEFFELCDGERKKIKANATKQPDFMRRN